MARPQKSGSAPLAVPAAPGGVRGVLWLLVVVAPWWFLTTAYDPFRLPKLVAAETLTLVSIVLLTLAWARRKLAEPSRDTLLTLAAVFGPLVAAASLGLLTSPHGPALRQGLAALLIGVAGAAAWSLGLSRLHLERLLRWTVVPAVGFALVGLGQAWGWFQPFAFETVRQGTRLAVTAFAGNAGEFGAFLLLPALVAQWRIAADPRGRAGWLAALGVLVAGQIASQTLTALAALVVASSVFWLFALAAERRRWLATVPVLAALLITVAVPPVRHRLTEVANGLTVGRINAALSGRLDGWRVAGRMFTTHPLTGVGLCGFAAEFAPTRLALQDEGVEFFAGHTEAFFANAHNDGLEWAAETGLVGIVALGFALWTLGRRLARWSGGLDRAFALATLIGLGLLAAAYFPFRVPLLAYPILLFFAWLLRASTEEAGEVPS